MIPGLMLIGQRKRTEGGGSAFRALALSHSPAMYLRLGESSGSIAANETGGTAGTYSGCTLAQAALYAGGPTSVIVPASANSITWPSAAVPASMSDMTLCAIYKPSAVTGTRQIIARDQAGARYFQWYMTGTNMAFTKIRASVQTVTIAHGMSAGVAYFVALTVSAAGVVKMFRGQTKLTTGSVTGVNYGGTGGGVRDVSIGNRAAASESVGDGFSEAIMIPAELSEAQIAALAASAGF